MEFKKKFLIFLFVALVLHEPANAEKKPYIVYLGSHEDASLLLDEQITESHYELLGTVLGSKEKAQDAIFYSYTKYVNGFAASLEEEEAREISKKAGVSVIPSKSYTLHTTHSWGFMAVDENVRGLGGSLLKKARFGEGVIIANIDSGVWPESKSFSDEGNGPIPPMGPIPSRWKGTCEKGFPCNRKLIGARFFNKGYISRGGKPDPANDSPRDTEGHGSHTLSTAAGRLVANASIFNNAKGTAKGGSPRARVATYKVCWPGLNQGGGGCVDSDILAAFEAAIHDGVDVISVSLGGFTGNYLDPIAVGSFQAMRNGISVICSAGNSGPRLGSVSNVAPWIFTVGASTIDRSYSTYLSLGNGKKIGGLSFSASGTSALTHMVLSTDVKAPNATFSEARQCAVGSLDPEKVKGKIVVCIYVGGSLRLHKSKVVKDAGGAGLVLVNSKNVDEETSGVMHFLPAIDISYSNGNDIFTYMNSTNSPKCRISTTTTEIGVQQAPVMAYFTSQGPNPINPEILKPDITAPGVDILAAFTQAIPPTEVDYDDRRSAFNLMSGTSMSCPHVSGIIGLFRNLHPTWSPAAIRSAIMTTAMDHDNKKSLISGSSSHNDSLVMATPFSYGAGHVNPIRAMDPGLVYDLNTTDYLNFLCTLGYNSSLISNLNGKPYSCPSTPLDIKSLNYPSISVPNLNGSVTVRRTLKNVGSPGTYHASFQNPEGISVSVEPNSLVFKTVGEEKKFKVTFRVNKKSEKVLGLPRKPDYVFGKLVWADGKHNVTSPIAVGINAN